MLAEISDTVYVDDPSLGINEEPFRIMERSFDMDNFTTNIKGDQTALGNVFRLDYSSLDSSDILS